MTNATTAAKTTDAVQATKAQAADEASDSKRKRVNYSPDEKAGKLVVTYGAEHMTLDAGDDVMADPKVRDHLAYLGLVTYLQRESSRASEDQKLDAIDEAYGALTEQGIKAFERKSNAPTGPKKADKIAALAMLKGRTPDAIRDALKKLPQSKQDELLNNPKVLAKVEELRSDDDTDLSV